MQVAHVIQVVGLATVLAACGAASNPTTTTSVSVQPLVAPQDVVVTSAAATITAPAETPTPSVPAPVVEVVTVPLTTAPGRTPAATTVLAPALDPRFDTCKEAKAHGYGPYVRGQDPEYAWYKDGDGDGTVCE